MDMKMQKKVYNLLLSKNFTVAFHDNGYCALYEGKFDTYDDLPESGGEVCDFSLSDGFDGYAPELIVMLVECLKGNTLSI